jgi:hypothetical protein
MDIETDIETINSYSTTEDIEQIESKTDIETINSFNNNIEENENDDMYISINYKNKFCYIFCNFIDKYKISIFIIYLFTVILLITYLNENVFK